MFTDGNHSRLHLRSGSCFNDPNASGEVLWKMDDWVIIVHPVSKMCSYERSFENLSLKTDFAWPHWLEKKN